MRFFKSCRRVKRTRAREMLFRLGPSYVCHRCPIPGSPRGERRLQKKPPENSESETNL